MEALLLADSNRSQEVEDKLLRRYLLFLLFLLRLNRSQRAAAGSLAATTACCSSNVEEQQAVEFDDNWSFSKWLCESQAPNVTNPDA